MATPTIGKQFAGTNFRKVDVDKMTGRKVKERCGVFRVEKSCCRG